MQTKFDHRKPLEIYKIHKKFTLNLIFEKID